MGTRRNKSIDVQNSEGLSAPLRTEAFWRRIHRADAVIKQGRKCLYCTAPMSLQEATADHLLAQKKGGRTTTWNIGAACQPCNSAKGHMSQHAFKMAIRRPQYHHRMSIWLASSRRRIWIRAWEAERRILRLAGLV